MRQIRDKHQRHNMQRKLQQDRKQDIEIEDVPQRTLPRELFDRLYHPRINIKPSHTLPASYDEQRRGRERTFALEMHKKHTLMSIPLTVI